MTTEQSTWTPLKLEDINVGDVLEWDSTWMGVRTKDVRRSSTGWIWIGDNLTARNQNWLDNPHCRVRRIKKVGAES